MNLDKYEKSDEIKNWAYCISFAPTLDFHGVQTGRFTQTHSFMIIYLVDGKRQTIELYATTEKGAHTKAVEFINGLNVNT